MMRLRGRLAAGPRRDVLCGQLLASMVELGSPIRWGKPTVMVRLMGVA